MFSVYICVFVGIIGTRMVTLMVCRLQFTTPPFPRREGESQNFVSAILGQLRRFGKGCTACSAWRVLHAL